MRLLKIPVLFFMLCSSMLFGRSQYFPQYGDIVREKFCWSKIDEVSGRDVTCFTQDSTGTFWFGLGTEILNYDGINWNKYTQIHGLPDAYVQSMVTAPDGRIFGVFESHGVYTLDDTLWHPVVTIKPDSYIRFQELTPVGADSFWLATNRGAVFYKNGSSALYNLHQTVLIDSAGNLQSDNEFPADDLDIYSIYIDRKDNLWFVDITDRNGRFIYIPQWEQNIEDRSSWKTYSASKRGITFGGYPKVFQSSDGQYWIYTYTEMTGIYRFLKPEDHWEHIDLTEIGGDNLVRSMIETDDGTVWFGGTGILYVFHNNKFVIYENRDLKIQIAPISMLQAKDGALWLLSANIEVNRIDYGRLQWNFIENVHYQCGSADGDDYFISIDGRIVQHSEKHNTWLSYGTEDGLMDMPMVVFTGQDETLWAAGSMKGKAAVSSFKQNKWVTNVYPELSWGISYQSALETRDGSLWFGSMSDPSGSYKGGVIVYDKVEDGYDVRHYWSDLEGFNRIPVLTQNQDGTIWAGGSQLMQLTGQNWNMVSEFKELQQSWIDFVLGTSDSSLWVAKGGVGLFRKKNNQWTKYTVKDNLLSNMVTSLLELPNQNVLAATPQGISRFNGKSWSKYYLPVEINIPRESGTLRFDPDGQLWINQTARNWYFKALSTEAQKRDHVFRCIKYRGDFLTPDTEISIYQKRLAKPANQYISWQGADHWEATNRDEMTFSYRLNSEPWSDFISDDYVQLLDIREGNHQFEVRAMDRDGNVDPSPAKIYFEVIPPLWKQPWFWSLAGLAAITIVGLLIGLSYQNRKLTVANHEIEKMASFKERFFINLSHEVRTPLTMILAPVSELLSAKEKSWSHIRNQLEIIKHHGHYLHRLVNQMLDFRKLELGKYRLQVAEENLPAFVTDVGDRFRLFADEHRIEYQIICDFKQATGWFDQNFVEMILVNLIGNAFKYTPDGGQIGVHLMPSPLKAEAEHQWIELRITDTGIGIPPDRLDNIFDRFYHVEHPGKLFYDSIGVGLDFTKEIVELHNGSITVESRLNQGSTFHVYLPVNRGAFSEDDISRGDLKIVTPALSFEKLEEINEERKRLFISDVEADQKVTASQDARSKPRLLIVEDHPDMREMLMQFFNDDYHVSVAENGRKGVKTAITEVPDCVISDVMMPEMDGIEFTRQLKSNLITCHIPIVLLTVKSEVEDRISGFETGADAYIAKPFVIEELRVRVRKLIEGREALKNRFSRDVDIDTKEVTSNQLDQSFLEKCIRIIEEKITDEDFNVEQFCKELGMSRANAYQKVKNISGFALNEFIIQIKLKRAAKMLVETKMNISEIAYTLGFSDHSHMNRHFKNAFNCSPKEYRKEHRQ